MLFFLSSYSWFARLVFIAIFIFVQPAHAQETSNKPTQKQLAAVLSAINYLLLDETEGGPITIVFGSSDNRNYGYNYGSGNYKNGVDIEFAGQTQDIQICFNAIDIQSKELNVELNGENVGFLKNGENCFTFTVSQQQDQNILQLIHNTPGNRWGINTISFDLDRDNLLTLPTLTRSEWDELSVKRVLEIFAYNGHPTQAQIQTWANMAPKDAIKEMLNFAPHNLKLSPLVAGEKYSESASIEGTFWSFREYLSDLSSNLPIPLDENNYERNGLGVDRYNSQGAWVRMATTRGLNPFRQKIGLWETNYHLAVNTDTSVSNRQLTYYYDLIMNAHAAGLPYEEVLAIAAKSAAVAEQYGHSVREPNARSDDDNVWVPRSIDVRNTPTNPYDDDLDFDDMYCRCNEDFAREIHQLFFGIFGEQDPQGLQHHEDVTIPETAKALTDMRVQWDQVNERFPETVDFQTEFHHTGAVDVLNTQITGANAAAKIDAIAKVAITHTESLTNLPIIIISGLADDELSNQKKQQLRTAWAAMPNKNFLEFIQAYAVSTVFHSPTRNKYFTSIDRFINLGNKLTLNNTESLLDHYEIGASWVGARGFATENVSAFKPLHNVFGGQTGIEASDAPAVLENNYNRFTEDAWRQRRAYCNDCDNNGEWRKDWASMIPKNNGVYRVGDVAEWLWQHFINDGGTNYTQVERAHLIALMGTKRDLNQLYCVKQRREAEAIEPSQGDINNNRTPLELLERDNPWDSLTERRCDTNLSAVEIGLLEKGFTSAELETPDMTALLNEMANRLIELDSADIDTRRNANEEVGQGVNFILATPFIMAQEAR